MIPQLFVAPHVTLQLLNLHSYYLCSNVIICLVSGHTCLIGLCLYNTVLFKLVLPSRLLVLITFHEPFHCCFERLVDNIPWTIPLGDVSDNIPQTISLIGLKVWLITFRGPWLITFHKPFCCCFEGLVDIIPWTYYSSHSFFYLAPYYYAHFIVRNGNGNYRQLISTRALFQTLF